MSIKLQKHEKEIDNLQIQLKNKETEINNLQSKLKNKETEISNLQSNLNNKEQELSKSATNINNNNYNWNNANQPHSFIRQNTYQPNFNKPTIFDPQGNLNQFQFIIHEDPFVSIQWTKCEICLNMNYGHICLKCPLAICNFCLDKIRNKLSLNKNKHPHNLFIKFSRIAMGFTCDCCRTFYNVNYYFYCKECNFQECLLCIYNNKDAFGNL